MKVKLILINTQRNEMLTLPIEFISRRNNMPAIAASPTSKISFKIEKQTIRNLKRLNA